MCVPVRHHPKQKESTAILRPPDIYQPLSALVIPFTSNSTGIENLPMAPGKREHTRGLSRASRQVRSVVSEAAKIPNT